MSIAFLLVFGGFVLVIAGIKNVSFLEAARGNFDVPKAAASPGFAQTSTPPAGSGS